MVVDFVLSFFRHLILHVFVISVLGSHLFAFIFAFCWHWFGICFAYFLGIVFAFVGMFLSFLAMRQRDGNYSWEPSTKAAL